MSAADCVSSTTNMMRTSVMTTKLQTVFAMIGHSQEQAGSGVSVRLAVPKSELGQVQTLSALLVCVLLV